MKCLRHKIHLNLFVSVLSANLAWLLVYVITVGDHFKIQAPSVNFLSATSSMTRDATFY